MASGDIVICVLIISILAYNMWDRYLEAKYGPDDRE